MNIAVDDSGARIKPFRGGRGTCPFCNGVLIAKCGEIYAPHWQHHKDYNCDSWKEHETEWHRSWKNNFPLDWQEVIVQNEDGEKHIADIKTANGMVVEFQNSSISPDIIRVREGFYGLMVWVINATEFKNNIELESAVTVLLRRLDQERMNQSLSTGIGYEHSINETQERIKIVGRDYAINIGEINNLKDHINLRNQQLARISEITTKTINYWTLSSYLGETDFYRILECINPDFKIKVKECYKKLNQDIQERDSKGQILDKVKSLQDIFIDGILHKLIPYGAITPKNYATVIAIEKATRNDIFMQKRTFASEAEFLSFKYRLEDFDFAINPIAAMTKLNEDIAGLSIEIGKNTEIISEITPMLEKEITAALLSDVKEAEQQLLSAELKRKELDDLLNLKQRQIEEIKAARDKDESDYYSSIGEDYQNKKEAIMSKWKGRYKFKWKYERKSWQSAERAIYFDFGKGFLYNIISVDVLEKLSYEDFVEFIKERIG